jgi:hypothetical protein
LRKIPTVVYIRSKTDPWRARASRRALYVSFCILIPVFPLLSSSISISYHYLPYKKLQNGSETGQILEISKQIQSVDNTLEKGITETRRQ